MMSNFQPFIPSERVSKAVVGKIEEKLFLFVKSFVPQLVISNENIKVDKAISNHADVNIFSPGNKMIFADSSQTGLLSEKFPEYEIFETKVRSPYPCDCRLNVLIVGKLAFAKIEAVDRKLYSFLLNEGFDFVNINQGYAKCSTCVVNENSVITDDVSIDKAARENGLDCLLIEKGDIRLCGYNYGFIGGASALVDKDRLIFFGDITKHKSFNKINKFLNLKNCKFDYLPDYPLTDIGGLVCIK